jgi:glycyl-tRNA synthetase
LPSDPMDTIVNLAKRRGFAFQSSEIYGGLRSSYDYGPLGVELKNNIKRAWWRSVVQLRDDVVGQDAAIIMAPRVWEASGHLESFSDPLVECTNCHQRFREDHLKEAFEAKHGRAPEPGELRCPNCGGGPFTDPRNFNLMFKTFMGPVEDASAVVWLRPETAQGIFVDFPIVQAVSRKKIPFGIAQIGKAFRNEITPGNFIFRTREFEQMELEFFVEPGEDAKWLDYWIEERRRWYLELGMREEYVRVREHGHDELAHRADFDLSQHQKFSGQDLTYHDQESNTHYIPYVVEPSAGADRSALAFLVDAYREEEAPTASGGTEKRTVLRFDPRLAPIKVAVLPLSRNEQLNPMAREVAAPLRERWMIDYDDARSIGRRYRRQDEIGTPFCVTVDFDSLDDRAVTVRDRDTMSQDRVGLDRLVGYLEERLPR